MGLRISLRQTSTGVPDEMAMELRRLRLQHGLSQKAFAKRAGLSTYTVNRVEKGLVSPTWKTLKWWLRALGVQEVAL